MIPFCDEKKQILQNYCQVQIGVLLLFIICGISAYALWYSHVFPSFITYCLYKFVFNLKVYKYLETAYYNLNVYIYIRCKTIEVMHLYLTFKVNRNRYKLFKYANLTIFTFSNKVLNFCYLISTDISLHYSC